MAISLTMAITGDSCMFGINIKQPRISFHIQFCIVCFHHLSMLTVWEQRTWQTGIPGTHCANTGGISTPSPCFTPRYTWWCHCLVSGIRNDMTTQRSAPLGFQTLQTCNKICWCHKLSIVNEWCTELHWKCIVYFRSWTPFLVLVRLTLETVFQAATCWFFTKLLKSIQQVAMAAMRLHPSSRNARLR